MKETHYELDIIEKMGLNGPIPPVDQQAPAIEALRTKWPSRSLPAALTAAVEEIVLDTNVIYPPTDFDQTFDRWVEDSEMVKVHANELLRDVVSHQSVYMAAARTLYRRTVTLDEPFRTVLVARYYAGFSAEQVASVFGVSTPTIEFLLSEGTARLGDSVRVEPASDYGPYDP